LLAFIKAHLPLDALVGADGWAMTPSGMCSVLKMQCHLFINATLASGFLVPVVRRVYIRDEWRRVPDTRRRADAADQGGTPPDSLSFSDILYELSRRGGPAALSRNIFDNLHYCTKDCILKV